MTYNLFSQDVINTIVAKRSIEAFAAMQTDGTHFCPRCGRFTVKDRLHTNALSRYSDVYICDECGLNEAIRAIGDVPLPLQDWAVAKDQMKGGSEI